MIVALVLAAGQGRRFGTDKRRAGLEGSTLLARSVERALEAFGEVRVILRVGERAEDFGLPAGCRVIHSPDAALGMGHSLAAGAASLCDSDARAVAVLLGDMPWIAPSTLRQLADAASASTILFPLYDGQRGHPVLFGRDFWPRLADLRGDEGARAVVAAHRERCVSLQVDDAGVLRDVDTPEALLRWAARA